MLASDWTLVTNDQIPPYSVFAQPIQKSEQDDREYRLIRLENGLHAMLIHDAKADKAAASLDVAVGHMSDPVSAITLLSVVERLSRRIETWAIFDHYTENFSIDSRMICLA
jgi:insulysin